MADWTARDVPELSGKTVVVTGGNSGLGFESARVLASKGAEVILACRSVSRGQSAKQEIATGLPDARLRVMKLDLQDLSSVEGFATEFGTHCRRLDVLLNNAGIMNTPYRLTQDGFESQMGTNHLGHFALTGRLLDVLARTPGSRVVTVSSSGHRAGTMDFGNLLFQNERGYTPFKAYSRSKLANLLFAYELQRRLERHGVDCMSLAAHPGAAQTDLGKHIEDEFFMRLLKPVLKRVVQGPESGALPQIRASADPTVRGGQYYGPDGLFQMSGSPVQVQSSRASRNTHDADKLWEESERLTGVLYRFS